MKDGVKINENNMHERGPLAGDSNNRMTAGSSYARLARFRQSVNSSDQKLRRLNRRSFISGGELYY